MWLFKVAKTSKYASTTYQVQLARLSPKTLLDHKASYFLVQNTQYVRSEGQMAWCTHKSSEFATGNVYCCCDQIVEILTGFHSGFPSLASDLVQQFDICDFLCRQSLQDFWMLIVSITSNYTCVTFFLMMTLLIMKYNQQIAAAVISVFQI